MRFRGRWLVGALALFTTEAARADIGPPPASVESCSVEKQKKSGEECVTCATFFAEPDKCVREHGARGYEFRCKTRGASKWTEVWCKAGSRAVITSLQDPAEAGAPVGHDAGAATPVTRPNPSSTAAPPATGVSPAPAAHPTPTSGEGVEPRRDERAPAGKNGASPQPPSPEKRGGCGACQIGALDDEAAGAIWWVGIAAWALRRRER